MPEELSNQPRLVRLQVELSDATIAAIDDYRFARRLRNRSEAVRHLLKVGQAAQLPDGDSTD